MSEPPEDFIPWTPTNFLALPPEQALLETARAVLIPVPYDSTTSHRGGAREGPAAIIEASAALEDYDLELDLDVSQIGIHTTQFLESHMAGPEFMVRRVQQAVAQYLAPLRVVGLLGGEHSISAGGVQAHLAAYPDLSVLYLDAHADLRDEYMGTPWGHASGARRISENCPVTWVGLRSMCEEERDYLRQRPQSPIPGGVAAYSWPPSDQVGLTDKVITGLTRHVYVSVDLDVFDPSLMAAVGTPEPGGMTWQEVTNLLRAVARERQIVGFDVCELAPREGPMACSYTAAKLVYKLLAYATLS